MQARSELEDFKAYLASRVKPEWQVAYFKVLNDSHNHLTVIAEPWGTPVSIPPGEECEILVDEPSGRNLSISYSDGYMQLWAEGDGIIEIFQDDAGYGVTGEYVEWQQQWRNENR